MNKKSSSHKSIPAHTKIAGDEISVDIDQYDVKFL